MLSCFGRIMIASVALRKESVDRNSNSQRSNQQMFQSLSVRRAWIEMAIRWNTCEVPTSLSVRRAWIEMMDDFEPSTTRRLSLSVRRAWIEMSWRGGLVRVLAQSLSARRAWIEMIVGPWCRPKRARRSPQGERG